ncbi:prephenate dehydratase [bacterium]|nr:prephenate dehydratase [bacterium]
MGFLNSVKEIVFLGPGGSYSEMAKDFFCKNFNLNVMETPFKTITQVIEYVDKNEDILGVIPVENSIEGAVREAIDCLIKTKNTDLQYIAEYVMPIRHCLLSKCNDINSVSGLISHPQAIAQCLGFIHNRLPKNIDIVKATSTAKAAVLLDEYALTYSAIGSAKTAELYNLNILEKNINDDPTNQTRFILIGKYKTHCTGNDKTSLAFSTENKPGMLLEALKVFQNYNINLCYIDSRPSKIVFGEYTFLVDFDGHVSDEIISKAIEELKTKTSYFRIVGSYEKLS